MTKLNECRRTSLNCGSFRFCLNFEVFTSNRTFNCFKLIYGPIFSIKYFNSKLKNYASLAYSINVPVFITAISWLIGTFFFIDFAYIDKERYYCVFGSLDTIYCINNHIILFISRLNSSKYCILKL